MLCIVIIMVELVDLCLVAPPVIGMISLGIVRHPVAKFVGIRDFVRKACLPDIEQCGQVKTITFDLAL